MIVRVRPTTTSVALLWCLAASPAFAQTICSQAPRVDCRLAGTSLLRLKRSVDDAKSKLAWRWLKGAATSQEDFGDPANTTAYGFCLYDYADGGAQLVTAADIAAGTDWVDKAPRGFAYDDRTGSSDGVTRVELRAGVDRKAKAILSARGPGFPSPAPVDTDLSFAQDPYVVAQLVAADGECWETRFDASATRRNDGRSFRAKQVGSPTRSTTTTTTTTSVTLPPPIRFRIEFGVGDTAGQTIGALVVDVDYAGARGEFVGSGGDIAVSGGTLVCDSLLSLPGSNGDSYGVANDDDVHTLQLGNLWLDAVAPVGPLALWACSFDQTIAGPPPSANDFVVTVSDASRPDASPIIPIPEAFVSAILPLP